MSDQVQYGLLVSFEDQSDSFVHGYEAGALSARMKGDAQAEDIEGVKVTVHSANRVTIERMCTAFGWSAEFEATDYSEWTNLTLTRASKPTERPNPHGLRIVP